MPTKYIYPIMDHRGNVVALTDEKGNVTGRREYNAFGEILSESGDWSGFRLGYQSNWIELKGGPHRLRVTPGGRLYSAELGRFLQRDPVTGQAGRYVYVENNPPRSVDPTGLWKIDFKGDGWTEEKKKAVQAAFDKARDETAIAIARVAKLIEQAKKWNEECPFKKEAIQDLELLQTRLKTMQTKLTSQETIEVRVTTWQSATEPEPNARTWFHPKTGKFTGRMEVHRDNFFKLEAIPKASTVFHENYHIAGAPEETDELKYVENARKLIPEMWDANGVKKDFRLPGLLNEYISKYKILKHPKLKCCPKDSQEAYPE